MAGIDKTYTSSYKEYKEFKDWADLQYVTFFDESKLRIGDWVWEYIEEDFAYGEIPIMNTPAWIDIYLIQNCKSDFVLSRMKSVHKEKSYLEFQNVKLSAKPPQEFKQNRKIVITKNERTRFPIHSKPYGGKMTWWLQCEDVYWGYNDVTRIWANDEMYYPTRTNTAHITSIKALIRHLRKQYLPKGIEFSLSGRYIGEDYTIKIK